MMKQLLFNCNTSLDSGICFVITRIVKVPFAGAVLLFLSLSQLSLGLYVQPSANIKGCEYSIFGSPPYIVMPYKGYVFIITREITTFDIHILRLDDGKIVNSFYIEGLLDTTKVLYKYFFAQAKSD